VRRAKRFRIVVAAAGASAPPADTSAPASPSADLEPLARAAFDQAFGTRSVRQRLAVGRRGAEHEFALHAPGAVIGAIITERWAGAADPRSGTTSGQDRASAELLWLCLWEGRERRVLIATDLELAQRLVARYAGCFLPTQVEVHHCDIASGSLYLVGRLGGE
jgi:hypothetical protein